MSVALHAGFGLSVLALGAAGLRAASLAAPAGLDRAVAAACLAAATAVTWALLLGLIGLGSSPIALGLSALVTWLAVRAATPAPETGAAGELLLWWAGRSTVERVAAGTLAGAGLAWTAWVLSRPSLGLDASVYHFAEVAVWVESGRPGTSVELSHAFPFGAYPLTWEVLLAWGAALTRSWVPMALAAPAFMVLLVASSWLGLRRLRVPARVALLAVVALVASPWLVQELNEPLTDLPSLAWLVSTGALCAAATRRPRLLAPALVAAGLALGTKTTALVPLAALLAVSLFAARQHLRRLTPALAAAAVLAGVVGGFWYLRNLVRHGSPAWPFLSLPWGDERPAFVEALSTRLLDRPGETLQGRGGLYASRLAGDLVLMAGLFVAPLLAPRRSVLIASGVALVALLAWVSAPVTGISDSPGVATPVVWPISTTRYLLPVAAAGALALCLAATSGGRREQVALVVLGAAAAWNLIDSLRLDLPHVPPAWLLFTGTIVGGLVAAIPVRLPPPKTAALVLAAAAAGAVLAVPADSFLARHAAVTGSGDADGRRLTRWLVSQPAFDGDGLRISVAGRFVKAQLAGERLQHRVELVPVNEPCEAVRKRAADGWLVLMRPGLGRGVFGTEDLPVSRCRIPGVPLYDDGRFSVFGRR